MTPINKGPFLIGIGLAFSFLAVLFLIFSPIFQGKNGLNFADDLFNKLSKGSSYFIPKISKNIEKAVGTPFNITLDTENARELEQTAKLLASAGARVEFQGKTLRAEGDLGNLLKNALRDADYMFRNEGEKLLALYGCDERETLQRWWTALSNMEKFLKKNLKFEESKIVSEVVKKGVEPAYNFYGVESQQVSNRTGIMTFLLLFYIVYTLWWGFAIYYLFEGFRLSMRKAKVKKEVG